jgi:hypothetical protein
MHRRHSLIWWRIARFGLAAFGALEIAALGGVSALASATCPERLAVRAVADQRAAIEREWFAEGGRTGGGIVATMEALPRDRAWTGARLVEQLTVDLTASDCPLPRPENICGTGGHATFVVGARANGVRLPFGTVVPWTIPAGARRANSFPDAHFVLDSRDGQPGGVDLLAALGAEGRACTVVCHQTYSCGAGADAVTYGPFTITYRFRHELYDPRLPDGRRNPLSRPVPLTRVDAAKR